MGSGPNSGMSFSGAPNLGGIALPQNSIGTNNYAVQPGQTPSNTAPTNPVQPSTGTPQPYNNIAGGMIFPMSMGGGTVGNLGSNSPISPMVGTK